MDEIKEQFYPIPLTADEIKNISEPVINVSKNWPNTYNFSKAITENMIATNGNHLPISIFRPSIFGSTMSEPYPGWVENINGPPGLVIPLIIGFWRVLLVDKTKKCDIIPADYIVNAMISVMWDTVNRHQDTNQIKDSNKKLKIFNFVSGVESPLNWGEFLNEIYDNYMENPPLISIWYSFYMFSTNSIVVYFMKFLLHRIPAAFMDIGMLICGKSPRMLKQYSKVDRNMKVLNLFMLQEWTFENKNTQELWLQLSQEDQHLFRFSFNEFNWKLYIKHYYYGIKKHLLKENENDSEKALSKNRRLFCLHRVCVTIIFLVLPVTVICKR